MDTQLAPIKIEDEDLRKTIEVLKMRFDNPDATITSLCEKVDLERRQYYRKLDQGEEIINALRELIMRSKRVELAKIATSRHRVVEKLVDKALTSNDIQELVKALEYLDDHEERLQRDLGASPGLEDEAREFLKKGPHTQRQESKFASIRVSEDEDGGARIDIMKEQDDIIDVTPEDAD